MWNQSDHEKSPIQTVVSSFTQPCLRTGTREGRAGNLQEKGGCNLLEYLQNMEERTTMDHGLLSALTLSHEVERINNLTAWRRQGKSKPLLRATLGGQYFFKLPSFSVASQVLQVGGTWFPRSWLAPCWGFDLLRLCEYLQELCEANEPHGPKLGDNVSWDFSSCVYWCTSMPMSAVLDSGRTSGRSSSTFRVWGDSGWTP